MKTILSFHITTLRSAKDSQSKCKLEAHITINLMAETDSHSSHCNLLLSSSLALHCIKLASEVRTQSDSCLNASVPATTVWLSRVLVEVLGNKDQ